MQIKKTYQINSIKIQVPCIMEGSVVFMNKNYPHL